MDQAYCIKCRRLHHSDGKMWVFKTGFIRIGTTDYPMGLCEEHLDAALPPILAEPGTDKPDSTMESS